ncbi:MAG: hypothetical protein ACI91J_002860 [Yoonia sp.]|jgi:hypothetical protein
MSHCNNFIQRPLTRREMLARCANGFGGVALASMMAGENNTNAGTLRPSTEMADGSLVTHQVAKAKSVIFLYMDGGPSQVDTFDPKPRLTRENGKPFGMQMEPTQFNNNGNTLASPWEFTDRGQCGMPISSLFPHLAQHADDLGVIRSMVSEFPEHTNANYFLHTGHGLVGRPSAGSWVSYGLGSENQNLPGFVVLNGGLVPPGGLDNFSSGFLPAAYQGSVFKPTDQPVANIAAREKTEALQRNKLALMRKLDASVVDRLGSHDSIESAIHNYELAFRMQAAVPELVDFKSEPDWLKKAYGFEHSYDPTKIFAKECLLARRLVERGVRFIEMTCPKVGGDRWDQHNRLKEGHENNARAVDQPISALITDLKARGLFDETLIIWAGEFGRTPFAQGTNGRDHNPFGFSIWMAGAGIKGGTIYGATDDYGYHAVENKVEIWDLHATMFHLLGVDHEKLTYRFSGRDMRLTDVHGHVVHGILS